MTYALLLLRAAGFRTIETLIAALIGVIGLCYLVETLLARPDWSSVAYHSVVPWLGGPDAWCSPPGSSAPRSCRTRSISIGSLAQDGARRRIARRHRRGRSRFSNLDIVAALGLAGLVNFAMMVMAAAVFHDGTHDDIADIETAYRTLAPLVGAAAAMIFLVSLLASGISSSVVGTMAGQVVMQGFVGLRIPLWLRRLVTMAPAVVIAALGVNATTTLVVSQVVLSLVLPVPVLTLILFTSRRGIMGGMANRPVVAGAAALAATVILGLNLLLLLETCGVALPL